MLRRVPTVSELQRSATCAASVVLPRYPDGPQSASALRGSRIGAYVASSLRGWPMPDMGKTKVSHVDMDALRAYLGDGDLLCEAAFSYNGDTAYLGENLGRSYNRPGTLCGAADIIVARCHMMVVDIKTGSRDVAPPAENWQLSSLAAMAQQCSWPAIVEDVTGVIAKFNRDGSWTFSAHTWTLDDLAVIRKRIDAMMQQWQEAQEQHDSGWGVEPTPNEGCYFCLAKCPHGRKHQEQAHEPDVLGVHPSVETAAASDDY